MSSDPFFKSIGALAQKTDDLPDDPENPGQAATTEPNEDDDKRPLQEIESLCMSCGEQGMTRMMLTHIPYFKEVIVMSFRCEHCGNENNEIQSAGAIRELGTLYTTRILARSDLDRQLVKSASATLVIPELELTIPASRGQLTTVEGIVRDTVRDLEMDQPLRRVQDEVTWGKIEVLVGKMKDILGDSEDEEEGKEGEGVGEVVQKSAAKVDKPMKPFTVQLDDPAGNSWIEFIGSMDDPKWTMRQYERTPEQNAAIGLGGGDAPAVTAEAKHVGSAREVMDAEKKVDGGDDDVVPNEEIYVFPGTCSSCSAPLDTMMKRVIIPYFKDIFIMSTNCAACGYRDNEIKSGGAISELGKRITLKVEDSEDLSRDILKSETCGLEIPEIDLVLHPGTLGGRFTTLEGLLTQVYEELGEKVFVHGDASSTSQDKTTFEAFLASLKEVMQAKRPFTVILDDPLANSYLQNLFAPDPDPAMTIESYERAWEQNEELGLNDMKVEGYNEDSGGEEVPEPGKEGAPKPTVSESLKEGFKEAYEEVKSGSTGIA
ncbi:putative ZPR1-protein binds to translation elongation factor eEF-1 [Ceratobasidium sp. AG-I]|nr:putative ZPR1-protein binds to translation elongation factor eEF-1 [Ceratobasidium sp. AG-I]